MDLLNPADDVLADTLRAIRVRSSVYCLSELRAPWGFRVDGANVAKFHLVLDGSGWLCADNLEPVRLAVGDLVVLPGGHGHVMCDEPGSVVQALDTLLADHSVDARARLRVGGDGALTRLLCGGFALENPAAMPARLPPILHFDSAESGARHWLEPVLALVRQEADVPSTGAQAVFAKLADVFLTQALRAYLGAAGPDEMLSPALPIDAEVQKAVDLIRQQPHLDWTVQSLAREVGLSRSLLAARFKLSTGETPMRHLARVRLGQAASYLTTASMSLDAIARRTGYGSTASLSKAFKREFGVSPGLYRRLKGEVVALRAG